MLAEFRKDLLTGVQGIDRVSALLERQTIDEADVLRAIPHTEADIDKLRGVFLKFIHQEFIQDRTFTKLQNSADPTLIGCPELEVELTAYYTDDRFLMDYLNQQEETFLDEQDTLDVLREVFEVPLPDFPMARSETEQNDVLIQYAESIAGRNFVKQNYLRRTRMIATFGRVQDESGRLIARIEARFASET